MKQITIAVGHSRQSTKWTNKSMTWEDFATELSKPHHAIVTRADYLNMTQERQARIKDIGGFVGGKLKADNGQRKAGNIALRSLLTIDIDHGKPDTWENFAEAYHGAAVCYSTLNHTAENPRLRIIVPFDRDVTPAEYEPLSRKFCELYGLLEYVDHTCHKPAQFFYWPSVFKGEVPYYKKQDGEALDAAEVLKEYTDPLNPDPAEWPRGKDEKPLREAAGKAGDPTEKPGVIGAFCRTYSIEEAIEKFLPDVYEQTATPGRYTYRAGHVAGGLVCYEDKFAYSHHETDPANLKLCNAFDLVRIHKYGERDKEAKPNTPVNKLPSYIAMQDLCINDTETITTMTKEKLKAAADDFAGIDSDEAAEWMEGLEYDRKGNIKSTGQNLRQIILNDDILKGVRYDVFALKDIAEAPQLESAEGGKSVDDEVLGKMALLIENRYGFKASIKNTDEMLTSTRKERGFNPVKDFITSTRWDGVERVETLLVDYLGALDNEANREVTRKWMAAAVARVFEPGRTFQSVLTLPGPQGIGKSTFLRVLAVKREWLCSRLTLSDTDQRKKEAVKGKWIIELSELEGLRKAEWQALKSYLGDEKDEGRDAYARRRSDINRRFVFAATTNDMTFLRDADKGNRRWWVVPVNGIKEPVKDWMKRLAEEVPQIWAEAYHYYKAGEDICNLTEQTAQYMERQQWEFSEAAEDPLRERIENYLNTLLPVDWPTRDEESRRNYFRFHDPLEAKGTTERATVSAAEFLWESEGMRFKETGYGRAVRKFNAYLRSNDDWEAARNGKRRYFRRKPSAPPEDDDL